MTQNINDRGEIVFASVENPQKIHKTTPNETNLIYEIPNMIYEKNVTISPISVLTVEFCEEQTILYVLASGKFD